MAAVDTELMIDKICRSCMCEKAEMQDVFKKTLGENEDALLLCDALMACAAVEINSGDGLPYLICDVCETKLCLAYEFKQQCEKSDMTLREITNQTGSKSNKEEDIVIQPDVHEGLFDEEDEDDLPLTKRKRSLFSNELTCSYCLKMFSSRRGLRVHLRQHTGDGLRYCPLCPSKYTRTNHLLRHMKIHDKPGRKHSCKLCAQKYTQSGNLFRHMKSHIEEVERKARKETESSELVEVKREHDDEAIKAEKVIERVNNASVLTDKEIEQQLADNNEIKVNQDDIIEASIAAVIKSTNDEDSMDIPLSQFPFSDYEEDDLENQADVSTEKEDTKDEDFEVKEKKPRGRPPKKDNTLYKCKECDKILTTYTGLKVHLRRHTGADLARCKTRECEFCDRKFKYKKSFVHHMQVEHGMSDVGSDIDDKTEELPLSANNNDNKNGENVVGSNERFQSNGDLDDIDPGDDFGAEDEDNAKRKIKVHTCHVCQAQFARANHLTRHMTLHRSVLTHKCDRCDQAFFTEELLKQHIEQQHINKPYICTTCNKPFTRGEHLIRHLKLHQEITDDGEHKCSICDAVFTRTDHLARHTKTHLMQDKRHVCIECGKAFNRLDNLKTHQRIHTGLKDNSKLHLCVYCGKEFNNSSNMIVHMRRHTGERPYKCNECGKGFPRSHDLKCHERTHSGEKPYLCTLCGKSFNKSNKLLRHSRVHTGERPYVCNICARAFTQSNDLALHMRRHTGARPYACGVCPARFIQSGQLKNHRRQTGHWMETQPDLKGGHRVEPVSSAVDSLPIKFKTFGRNRVLKIEDAQGDYSESQQSTQLEPLQRLEPAAQLQQMQQPQRILMGIMGNLKLPNDGQPLIIDGNKFVELPGGQLSLVTLPTVIHGEDGEEIKLKTEISSFNLTSVEDELDKHENVSTSSTFHEGETVSFSAVQTSTTYTSADNFTFQTFH